MKSRLAVLFAVLSFAACSSPSSPSGDGVILIRATTSFGFCLGYCSTSLEITRREAVLIEEGTRSMLPPRRSTAPVSAAEWDQLRALVDRARIEALPAVLGCPDCADGGAESLEVVGDGWSKRVTFDFGADVRELQPLLDRVRDVRERARP